MDLVIIYRSNIPVDCHILRGRLLSEGIEVYLFDENVINVYPFYATAVRGVKLMVPSGQAEMAKKLISRIKLNKLLDTNGEYYIIPVFENEMIRQNEILEIKSQIRKNPLALDKPEEIKSILLKREEIKEIIEDEIKFQEISLRKFDFTWKQFWYELFDPDRSIFRYLRVKPVEFFLEKELVDVYENPLGSNKQYTCPNCGSHDVSYGHVINNRWQVLYLLLSLLIIAPFPVFRKNHHCFQCKHDF